MSETITREQYDRLMKVHQRVIARVVELETELRDTNRLLDELLKAGVLNKHPVKRRFVEQWVDRIRAILSKPT